MSERRATSNRVLTRGEIAMFHRLVHAEGQRLAMHGLSTAYHQRLLDKLGDMLDKGTL